MMPSFKFAILESNILAGLGLKQLLEDIIPIADIDIYTNIEDLKSVNDNYIHYFVSSRQYFENTSYFRTFPHKIIVLVSGDMLISGVRTLNVCQSESALAKAIIRLKGTGHSNNSKVPSTIEAPSHQDILSAREVEVARLLSKGLINKEIADQLNISTTTVITHRKNIMEKLHARSLADVIIFSVMNGLVDVEEV